MPKQTRQPRPPKRTFKAWSSAVAAQRAVVAVCAKEFRKLFGTRATVGWRNAWLNRLNDDLAIEIAARAAAQDFARYSLTTAKARAAAMFELHGVYVEEERLALDYIRHLPPVATALFIYLANKNSDSPFILDGEMVDFMKPKGARARKLWKDAKSITQLNKNQVAILTNSGKRHVVDYVVKRERLRSGEKWDRSGGAGAFADVTTLDGFVIANFEQLSYENGPAEPFSMNPKSPRKYASFYATDRELAVFSVLLCPSSLTVKPQDVANGTSASTLLDQHRHNVSIKRKHLGYLETTATQQVLSERIWNQPTGTTKRGSRQRKSPTKVTEKERREWIKLQMQRPPIHLQVPPILPIVPWPR